MNIFIGFATFSEDFIFYQASLLYEFFKQNGYNLVKNASSSDIIILAGIPFNIFEEKKALLTINYYLKKYPDKDIITIGHLSDMIYGLKDFGKLKVIGSANFDKFNHIFKHNTPIQNIEVGIFRFFLPLSFQELYIVNFGYEVDIKSNYKYTEDDLKITVESLEKGIHNISGIKEYDSKYNYLEDKTGNLYIETCFGCSARCSYCVINKVGFVKSKPLEEIINEITKGLSSGKKSIYLMEQDTASYGIDIGLDFTDLLNEINKIPYDFKVKIHFLEPGKLKKLYNKIDKSFFKNRLDYANISLQTTSQRILKLMNRSYDIKEIIDIISDIRSLNNDVKINTTIMYGFPTETFEEFKDYFNVIKYFDYTDFILYSEKKGLALSKIKKNTIPEIYQKYRYYQKIHKLLPKKVENSYFLNVKIQLMLKYLY